MTTWILETLYHDISIGFGHEIKKRMTCCKRIGRCDVPGVWLVNGSVRPRHDDTFESRQRCIGMDEYKERVNRMHCYSLAVHMPVGS